MGIPSPCFFVRRDFREPASFHREVRLVLRYLAATLLLAASPGPTRADGEAGKTTVSIDDGLVRVDAQITVPSTADRAWKLLSDVESLPNYVPHVETSRVYARTDTSVLVRQVMRTWLVLHWTFRVNIEFVNRSDGVLRFRQTDGVGGYRGEWGVEAIDAGVRISFGAAAEPSMLLPDFVMAYIVRKQVSRLMTAIAGELQRRV